MNKNIVYKLDIALGRTFKHCISWELGPKFDLFTWSTLDSKLELPNRVMSRELRSEVDQMIKDGEYK